MDSLQPEPLAGGNMTGGVVRIGDRVHRPRGPQSPTVERLLTHVRAQGVTWVPRHHGTDAQGREVLDFLPGEVHHDTPEWMRADENLRLVGARLREWHDATATFERRDTDRWWWQPGKEPQEVICHVDFAPYNHVYQGQRWVGAIDFDLCYPGPRVWDVAYTAYRYVPLTPHVADAVADGDGADRSSAPHAEQRRRLSVLLDGYGPLEWGGQARPYAAKEVLALLPERLVAMADWCASQPGEQMRRWGLMYRAHAAWIAEDGLGTNLES